MKYSAQEVLQYVQEEDVKFIRLAFCDVFGRQKNISIMPQELDRAFAYGIAFDASSVAGFAALEARARQGGAYVQQYLLPRRQPL